MKYMTIFEKGSPQMKINVIGQITGDATILKQISVGALVRFS